MGHEQMAGNLAHGGEHRHVTDPPGSELLHQTGPIPAVAVSYAPRFQERTVSNWSYWVRSRWSGVTEM